MSKPQENPFWNREIDRNGRAIRADVRCAAQLVWQKALQMTESILGDAAEAAEILESCVARVSRKMDERMQDQFTQRTCALLLVAFRNALRSCARKRRRLQCIGDATAFDGQRADFTWESDMRLKLDLTNFVRQLSPRSRVILGLRRAGYEWREVAGLLGVTIPCAKNAFWREIKQLQAKLAKAPPIRAARSTSQGRKLPQKSVKAISSAEENSNSTTDVSLFFSFRPPPCGLASIPFIASIGA